MNIFPNFSKFFNFLKPTTNFVLKANPYRYKIKDLNWEKIIGSFYEKEL